jgi:hypothetical protein
MEDQDLLQWMIKSHATKLQNLPYSQNLLETKSGFC